MDFLCVKSVRIRSFYGLHFKMSEALKFLENKVCIFYATLSLYKWESQSLLELESGMLIIAGFDYASNKGLSPNFASNIVQI